MNRVLIVTPSFPPNNAPDMQRVRMSLPHYREHGWEPVVLAVNPDVHGGPRENTLNATVPADVAVHRCGALSLRWSRLFGIGNLGLRAWFHLLIMGLRIIRRENIDLVFLSNSQFATFPLGRIWRICTRVSYVLDVQDPWRTDYYDKPGAPTPPGGWKYRIAHAQAALLEGWSFRRAAAVMSVSENYLEQLSSRYSWFGAKPTAVIRFGASENDFATSQSLSLLTPLPASPPFRLVYTGVVSRSMQPTLKAFLDALAEFKRNNPSSAPQIRCDFVGTSYAGKDEGTAVVLPLARALGVDDIVHEQVERVGHIEALRLQSKASALLLLGTDDPAYSPSKIYPYFLSQRPILSVVTEYSLLETILRELACSVIATVSNDGSKSKAHERIVDFLVLVSRGNADAARSARDEDLFRREYLAPALTARQCALFDRALQNS